MMENFIDDSTGHGIEHLALMLVKVAEVGQGSLQLFLTHLFKLFAQGDDGWSDSEVGQPFMKAADLLIDNLVGLDRLLLTLLEIGLDHALKIVNIIEINAVNLAGSRINVARNGDVDQKHRLIAPHFTGGLEICGADDIIRRSRR